MKLVFATNNKHKLDEIRAILGDKIELLSLNDINCHDDIPETADTLQGNALIKARYIYDKFGVNCFADDTGLEVDSLGGEPGVYSARYAGVHGDDEANNQKLIAELEGKADFDKALTKLLAETFKNKLESLGIKVYKHYGIDGYPYNIPLIASVRRSC